MRLYEHEAKQVLANVGFAVPKQFDLTTVTNLTSPNTALRQQVNAPVVLKGQVLFGNRLQAGFIQVCHTPTDLSTARNSIAQATATTGLDPQHTQVLLEEIVPFTNQFYLAIRYDTRQRQAQLLFSNQGGSGIEDRRDDQPPQEWIIALNPNQRQLPVLHEAISASWLDQFITTFFDHDMTLLEINPLVIDERTHTLTLLDVKLELDDTAAFRHKSWQEYPPRTLFARPPTPREQAAKTVNAMDHRGVAGASYFEFGGSIGILASGGGASLLAMDALLSSSLQPANYTEYSGNPPREKVRALSEIVLSQPNLEGLWIIGGHANFTDIYETLMGVMDAVTTANLPRGFPIVIRRGGPRQQEAFHELQQRAANLGLNIQIFDSSFPITDTVAILEAAVQTYRGQHVDSN